MSYISGMRPPNVRVTGDQFNDMLKAYGDGQSWPLEFSQSVFGVGDVKLASTVKEIPENVIFEGNLDASESKITIFDNEVRGDANFSGCASLNYFGDKTKFKGNLDASKTGLGLFTCTVHGDANLGQCEHLHTIMGATVLGTLTASHCPALGKFGAVVGRNLDLRRCGGLTEVEPGTRVLGDAISVGSSLPDGVFEKPLMAAAKSSHMAPRPLPIPDVPFTKVLEAAGIQIPSIGRTQE